RGLLPIPGAGFVWSALPVLKYLSMSRAGARPTLASDRACQEPAERPIQGAGFVWSALPVLKYLSVFRAGSRPSLASDRACQEPAERPIQGAGFVWSALLVRAWSEAHTGRRWLRGSHAAGRSRWPEPAVPGSRAQTAASRSPCSRRWARRLL